MKKEKKNVESLAKNQYIEFGLEYRGEKGILIIGNFDGLFGKFKLDEHGKVMFDYDAVNPKIYKNLRFLVEGIKNECEFRIVHHNEATENLEMLSEYLRDSSIGKRKINACLKHKAVETDLEYLEFINKLIENNMKFDYVIQNPPYSGSLHLEFLKKGLELLKPDGKMTIIEPATWLISIRRSTNKEIEIKEKLKGRVKNVTIENFNKEFGTGLYVPFAITNIDFGQEFEEIELKCCGEKRIVKSLNDCNLIGEYDKIWGILNKINCEKVKQHVYIPGKSEKKEGMWYCKYAEMIGMAGCCIFIAHGNNPGMKWDSEKPWTKLKNNIYHTSYIITLYHNTFNNINDNIHFKLIPGGKNGTLSNKEASCITGSKQELENWKYFVFNNKLPLFINIVMTIHQQNVVLPWVPWLVDKQYTDEEIAELFGFTEEEQAFIDKIIKKYERHSPWFKRYMCGQDSVSDEEVQKFIDSL